MIIPEKKGPWNLYTKILLLWYCKLLIKIDYVVKDVKWK